MTLAEKYGRLYDQCVPPDLGRETLRLLAKLFEETYDFVEGRWQASEAKDLLPHVRRANVEQDWRSLCTRTPGIAATAEKIEMGGGHYTIVTAGRLSLTASFVETPFSLPRPAEFRRQNAEAQQLDWIKKDIPLSDASQAYAILIYGGVRRKLGFAYVAFPDSPARHGFTR